MQPVERRFFFQQFFARNELQEEFAGMEGTELVRSHPVPIRGENFPDLPVSDASSKLVW